MSEFESNSTEIISVSSIVMEFTRQPLDPRLPLVISTPLVFSTVSDPELEQELPQQYQFGIVNITTQPTEMVTTRQNIMFSVDISGSMNDRCADGNSKMQQIINTITNILTLASESNEKGSQIFIQVDAFDDQIEKIIEMQKVTKDNLTSLIKNIKKMRPRGTTNIELALQNANEVLSQIQTTETSSTLNSNSTPTHIFLTDGNPTSGCSDKNKLKELIDSRFRNIFIGYGRDHSAELLLKLSETKNSRYLFIDKLEYSGYAFGEIIHEILYAAFQHCVLKTENAEIYEYETNTWTNTIHIGLLTGETNKTYHVRSKTPIQTTTVQLLHSSTESNPTQLLNETTAIETSQDDNLAKYMFRQKVLEVLFNARTNQNLESTTDFTRFPRTHHSLVLDLDENNNTLHEPTTTTHETTKEILKNTMNYIKEYMKEKNIEETNPDSHKDYGFYSTLLDDLYITYKTYGTQYGEMYSTSRANSQGRQQSYNISELPDDYPPAPPKLRRYPKIGRFVPDMFEPEPVEKQELEPEPIHTISRVPLNRAYTSVTAENVMRAVSEVTPVAPPGL
jgi:hypothetical protein